MILVIATLISVASMGSTPGQPVPRPPPRPRRQTIGAAAAGRGAIGFSSFAVLLYYAIANASAWTLGRRIIPAVGLVGCLVLAFVLPVLSVAVGAAVVAIGAARYGFAAGRHKQVLDYSRRELSLG